MCRYEKCDYQLIRSFLRWHWNVKAFCSRNANELFHTSPEGRVSSSVGCAAVWNSISLSNIFLFFRGALKLIRYIILLLHETNQRPLCVLGWGCCKTYWLIWNQISLSVYCIVCVHFCYRVSHGYFWLEKGSETTPSPLYAWRMCNRHRRKESINLILHESKLIFCYKH